MSPDGSRRDSVRTCLVALAGNPNTGKTTVFNQLTGSQDRVGNYPGITVELSKGTANVGGTRLEIVDIPGTYSVLARSPDEEIAVCHLLGLEGVPAPDVVVVCADATNLVRNLYLVLQLQEFGQKIVLALTMMDEARTVLSQTGTLARVLGCPVVPMVPNRGQGFDELRRAVAQTIAAPAAAPVFRWTPSAALAEAVASVRGATPEGWKPSDALALWALMSVDSVDTLAGIPPELRRAVAAVTLAGEAIDDEAVRGRYRWLDAEVAPLLSGTPDRRWTRRADSVLINPVWGFFVFLAVMFVLFEALFAGADPAIQLVEGGFAALANLMQQGLPRGVLTDLLVEGVVGGVGSVVAFLPQILLLFFFLGLMEDSGYLARVAFLVDRVMRLLGLHGRAFIPMLSGFACAVPAIMATRTMERQRDRLLTMLVVPLMTCSARLPVYTLIVGALFPVGSIAGVLPIRGTLMIGLYLFAMAVAFAAAWVLSKTVVRGEPTPLLLELPPYRLPRLIDVIRMMWRRARYFLTEAGTVILACTVVMWGLLTFPRDPAVEARFQQRMEAAASPTEVSSLQKERAGEELRHSYAGRLGRVLEPAVAPLGFDWKIGIGLIGAFAAREVFVSTLGVVYNVGKDADETSASLRDKIRAEQRSDGRRVYTPLSGLSLLVFFALACQCMSTLAVVRRETGSYRWPLFLFGYMSVLAWVASFAVYQGGRLLGLE